MNNALVIFLCILGAGANLLIGYAMFKYFMPDTKKEIADVPVHDGMTQQQYMRAVRLRNQEQLEAMYMPRGPQRPLPRDLESAMA